MDMEPVYIRRSEAEVLWEKRHPEAAEGGVK
jgi:tRNA threonylcarbamoyladenosine biosynthesis protein TsaB